MHKNAIWEAMYVAVAQVRVPIADSAHYLDMQTSSPCHVVRLLPINMTVCCIIAVVQVRVPIAEVALVVRKLVDSQMTWQEVAAKYPQQKAAEEEQQ
jgi:hypothetical protein